LGNTRGVRSGVRGILTRMGEPRLIEQAYRFALRPTPEQERFLEACAGASRFFFNWGLALVETRLRLRRAYGPSVAVPWSYKELCSEFAKVKDEVAPWRSEVVVGSQQAGLEALGAGLQRFLDGRRTGKRVGFPRYRCKGRSRESVIFQRPRIIDGRRVEFDRRLGPMRSRERFTKLQRLLERDEHARIKRATVQRRGSKWYVSFTVSRSPKQRGVRQPNTVVGMDVGIRQLATLSTGERVENLRPLQVELRRLRRLQRSLDRQRRANNPGNYDERGRAKPGRREWVKSKRMLRTEAAVRRLHERVANRRREQAHRLTTMLTRECGVIAVESLNITGMKLNRRLARHISDAGWGIVLAQLKYKTAWAGSRLEPADRYYPSSKTCSECGTVKAKLSLSERVFTCEACGVSLDRDENAARNLARIALAVAQAQGGRSALFVAATGAETLNARGATDPEALGPEGRQPRTAKAPSTGHPAVEETAVLAA
jgi:putative transposase